MPHVCPRNAFVLACAVIVASAPLGCFAPPVEAPKTTVEQATTVETKQDLKDKVDLLFLIDDSRSMSPKQEALKARFQDFIKQLDQFKVDGNPARYQIGVVTSSMGGQGLNLYGALQARGKATTNAPGCKGPVGKPFLEYDQIAGTNNAPAGQTIEDTFKCMATVVDPDSAPNAHYGSGFEMQLEAVYQALHDPVLKDGMGTLLKDNTGFLRPDAILAVVFITDEDDCSVEVNAHQDFFSSAPDSITKYGPLNSYRCARFGIACDGKLLDPNPSVSYGTCGPATPAQGSPLVDVEKYVRYFSNPSSAGGVKADPRDVILAAITAPATPVSSYAASGSLNCGSDGSCTNISHSCTSATDPGFFGDPSQRLTYVVGKAANHQLTSICQTDYKDALLEVGKLIVTRLKPACLAAPLRDLTNPDCVVEDITGVGADATHVAIPFCVDQAKPTGLCWFFKDAGTDCARVCNPIDHAFQHVAIDVHRDAAPAPSTVTQASCATIAVSKTTAEESPDDACLKP